MSSITVNDGMVKINNRTRYLPRITSVIKSEQDSYAWFVTTVGGSTYEVWGGKRSGGRANEWYIDGNGYKALRVTGPMDALKLIDGAL
jgi:hypothetical protein